MWIALDGHGCGDSTGSITVNSVKLERWTGVVRSVSLSFSEDCPGPGTGAGHHQGTFDYLAPLTDQRPGQVTGIHVDRTGSGTSLSWTNPADADLASIVVAWRRGERPVGSPNAGHFATSTAGTSATITGLPKGQPVTVELWAVDPLGQVGHGTVLTLFR
jgi:hypothetical protein